MDSYQRLLVVVDEHDFSLKAVSRAVYLAGKTHAIIIVMMLEHSHFVNRLVDTFESENNGDQFQPQTKERKQSCLTAFIRQAVQSGLNISKASIACHSSDDVLQFCEDYRVDAVILAASRHKLWNWLTIKPLDVRLIRESSRPVVVVKDHIWHPGGHILSLVEPCADDMVHKELNETVLQTSEHFSELLCGDCHLIDCYYGDTPSISFHQTVSPANDEHFHLQQMSQYSTRYHLQPENTPKNKHIHLTKSLPEDAIESLAKEVDSELVIVGDTGKTDLFSSLCGNVGEQVIDRIQCDLLVVKARGIGAMQ
ncbi:universal stress protein [Shewanella psychrotolerans]|uniref:universal stress protein n=1 Tax=Shewanella psychrotolerans TaxID=2864206 RepID=UPI001C661158|nr:universal stress protein [Shewanella psychrotolerans]QYK00028.1 universal stress protein [Shewanella psychrotolerans]